jgi:hypothetical protein
MPSPSPPTSSCVAMFTPSDAHSWPSPRCEAPRNSKPVPRALSRPRANAPPVQGDAVEPQVAVEEFDVVERVALVTQPDKGSGPFRGEVVLVREVAFGAGHGVCQRVTRRRPAHADEPRSGRPALRTLSRRIRSLWVALLGTRSRPTVSLYAALCSSGPGADRYSMVHRWPSVARCRAWACWT